MGKKSQQGQKGNPAAHRMGNDRLKARRAACWSRGEKRKEARQRDNDQRRRAATASKSEASNLSQTDLTPNETARMLRTERRGPLRQAFALWPKDRPYVQWLESQARAEAFREGELIREAQRRDR